MLRRDVSTKNQFACHESCMATKKKGENKNAADMLALNTAGCDDMLALGSLY